MRPGAGLYIYIYIYIMQARFHRNIAASSLAADCNVPQRPPAIIRSFTSIQMVHTHTHQYGQCTTSRHTKRCWITPQHYITVCTLHLHCITKYRVLGITCTALQLTGLCFISLGYAASHCTTFYGDATCGTLV